ncbi:MAG TPA: hypothetical protein VD996_01075 [Chitinophagaceae bacterium]|nr:hypothetical protein [Chitinophagaceae bacterium]
MISGKRVLVISPQPWGKMFVAKHHYAVELTRAGNEVFFLNPPADGPFKVNEIDAYPGLSVVSHKPSFPVLLRFRARWLYDLLMKRHVQQLVKKLGGHFHIVWCFEMNLYSDLTWFGAPVKIYHPVDELFYDHQRWPGKKADLIISVTREILQKFEGFAAERKLVNHGISREFKEMSAKLQWTKDGNMSVGYSGNLLRKDIDFATMKECIRRMPHVQFIFWGNYIKKDSNLAGNDNDEVKDFIDFLSNTPNVTLRGQVSVAQLAQEYQGADVFVICYDIEKDQSKGTNYHKVIEFLSTGRVIVSNNITTYDGLGLFEMCRSRSDNNEFPGLLEHVIQNIEQFNSIEKQQQRKAYAHQNTYEQHLVTISKMLS